MFRAKNYLVYLILDILLCSVFAYLFVLKGFDVNLVTLTLCCIFSIIFMPVVIRRLPIFKKYYVIRKPNMVYAHRKLNHAEERIAPVMCSLLTAGVLGLFFYLIQYSHDFLAYCFIGGISAGFISFYYETKF